MADVNARIGIDIDASDALAQLKSLQRQLSQFHTSVAKSSEAAAAAQKSMQRNLINSINALGSFSAEMRTVRTTAESFANSLEKNKFSLREYFRYAGASTKTFGSLFRSEFDTISKVAEDRVKRMQTQYIKMGRDASGAMKAIAVIPNELDMSNLNTQMQMAAQRQALFNQLVKQGSTNLLNFGKNTQWAGRQLMVGFTIPMIALGNAASKTFMDMETAALKFRKVYGDLFTPREETQQALESIKELGQAYTQYGISVSQTVALAAEAAAAGFQGLDLQRQVTEATRLQILGQVDQQKALETTISLQNAFQMSSEDLAESINFLNAVENQTVVSLDDITTAIPKAAPVVKQLGGNVKDLAFFMAAMKEGGINASEGANALKSGLASLINPTNKARDMMKGFGIDIDDIVNRNAGNVKQTVIEFATALDGLSDLNRQRAIEQLFGKFQLARLSTLFENVTKSGNQASRVLDLATASTADLAAMAQSELGMTADSAMNKFRKSVEDLKFALIPLGETFLNVFTPFIESITGILERFNNLGEGTKRVIATVALAVGAVGPVVLMTFGLLANGLANIIKLGLSLRNGYLRITGQSELLQSATQYLTSEQIDAAAAAASLDQAHANLTQQFVMEKTALDNLVIAYQNALRASQQFAAANPGMILPRRRGPERFANGGIIKGPGTGTSDSILIKASNGEAVIPADSVARYPEIVNALISNNIPGFAKGGRIGSGASGRIGKAETTVVRPYGANVSSTSGLVDFLDIDPNDIADVSSMFTRDILTEAGVSIKDVNSEIDTWRNNNLEALERATLSVEQGADPQEAFAELNKKFARDMESSGGAVSKFTKTAERMMPELSEDLKTAQQKARELGLNVKSAADATKLAAELPENRTAQKISKPGRYLPLAKARSAVASIFGGAGGIRRFGIPRFMTTTRDPKSRAYKLATSQEHISTTEQQEINLASQRAARAAVSQVEKGVKAGVEESTQQKSPSKKAKKAGENIGTGAIQGIESKIDDAKVAGEKVGSEAVKGVSRGPETKSAFPKRGRQSRRAAGPSGYVTFPDGQTVPAIVPQDGFGELNIIPTPTRRQRIRSKAIRTKQKVQKNFRGTGGIASSVAFGASMLGGPVGDVASRIMPLVFAFDALGAAVKILPRLLNLIPGPIKLLTVAATAGFAAWKFYNKKQEEARQKIEGLGNAATLTEGKLKTLGDIFGIAPTQGRFARQREAAGQEMLVAPTQRTVVQQIKSSEDFQKEFAKDIEALKNASTQEVSIVLQSLGRQLLGSGFTADMVKNIITAIQEEAGKTNIVFDFKSIDLTEKGGLKSLQKSTNQTLNMFSKAFEKGYEEKVVSVVHTSGNRIVATTKELQVTTTKEFDKTFNLVSKSISGTIEALSDQFENGTINAKQFNTAFNSISTSIQKMPKAQAIIIMSKLMQNLPEDLRESATGIKDMSTQMLLLKAQSLGVAGAAAAINAALFLQQDRGQTEGGMGRAQASNVLNKFKEDVAAAMKVVESFTNATDDSTNSSNANADGTKKLSLIQNLTIARYKQELDLLKKKRDALKEVNDEIERQNRFQQKQNELSKQMVEAKISGDYIQAALVGQQKSFEAAQFAKETEQIELDKRISRLEERISSIQAGARVTKAEEALTKAGMPIPKAKKKYMGGLIKKYSSGGLIVGPGTGRSDSILGFSPGGPIALSNNEYVVQAQAVKTNGLNYMNALNSGRITPGVSSNGSTAVYNNITMSVSGVQDPQRAADIVIQKLQTISNKTNRTNSVSNNRSVIG